MSATIQIGPTQKKYVTSYVTPLERSDLLRKKNVFKEPKLKTEQNQFINSKLL